MRILFTKHSVYLQVRTLRFGLRIIFLIPKP